MNRARGSRARPPVILVALLAGLSTVAGREQQESSFRVLMQTPGLPPIDRGLRSQDPPREPRGGQGDRNGAGAGSQSTYLPGSVIVKYANRDSFEILDIPSTADAEAAAETLRSRSDVEYAQPRYF